MIKPHAAVTEGKCAAITGGGDLTCHSLDSSLAHCAQGEVCWPQHSASRPYSMGRATKDFLGRRSEEVRKQN